MKIYGNLRVHTHWKTATGSVVGLVGSAIKDGVIINPIGKFPETFDTIMKENEEKVSNIDWKSDPYNTKGSE